MTAPARRLSNSPVGAERGDPWAEQGQCPLPRPEPWSCLSTGARGTAGCLPSNLALGPDTGYPSISDLQNLAALTSVSPPAANYSMPVVSAPTAAPQDEELTFTCTSKDGYPRPNVYWINKTDNSLLDEALQNSTVSLNAQGLYDVVSILRIRRTPHVNVGCCIENVLLHQNLTVSSQKGSGKAPQDLHARPNHGSGPGVLGEPLRQKIKPL